LTRFKRLDNREWMRFITLRINIIAGFKQYTER
jgi:hypothetical protein